ncbi:hypothetical protein EV356DRAFT_452629 [Viridothelium virens]|uniref:DNA repair protein Rad26 n=1 Tax=Viridothelium virens TaxID=1048519 RepID=A0A6A6GZ77_VIRVR|nr:hypothetical protein EV356DRAFT_452629 [Viridothelium virens]
MAYNVNNDEDDFLGDDFDDIPANTLRDLETKAILCTQHVNSIAPAGPESYGQKSTQNITGNGQQSLGRDASALTASIEGPDGSDYGFDDEDVINLDAPSTIYNPTLRPANHGDRNIAHVQLIENVPNVGTAGRPYQVAHRTNSQQYSQHHNGRHATVKDAGDESYTEFKASDQLTDLQKRVKELEQDRNTLLKNVEDAKASALSKAGEIAIVRSNHDKASKEYERRLAVIQNLHAEQIEKQKRELELARKDREKVETTNKFLEHDLAQEADRARQIRRTLQDRPINVRHQSTDHQQSPVATPKRGKIAPFRDGFEDDEVMLVSPSKSKQKAKQSTPKAAGKRKRPVENSPIKPLDIDGPPEPPSEPPNSGKTSLNATKFVLPLRPAVEDQRFKFLQKVMNHRTSEDHARTFEVLSQYKLASKPDTTLSSQLNDEMAFRTYNNMESSFPIEFCRILISLWRQCVNERIYAPIYLLIDLLQFILDIEPVSLAAGLIEDIVPVVINSVDLVALPIAKSSLDPSLKLSENQTRVAKEIDALACLRVFQNIVETSKVIPGSTTSFWRRTEFDFVLLMLNKAQPLPQIMLMLRLLATSAHETTFGAICDEASPVGQQRQQKQETDLLDRLTSLLIDKPQKPDNTPYSKTDILELRLEVLNVLFAFSMTGHGTVSLVHHRYAIGRLIRFLQDAVNSLYLLLPTPESLSLDTNSPLTPHQLASKSINLLTRLLRHLLIKSDSNPIQVNVRDKVAVIHGGSHKFYVALSRLAFSERVVLEAGIDGATVDAAHDILDSVLSPEEGEAFGEVFESPRRTA